MSEIQNPSARSRCEISLILYPEADRKDTIFYEKRKANYKMTIYRNVKLAGRLNNAALGREDPRLCRIWL